MEKKTLGLFTRSTASVLVGSLIATVLVAFIWSFVESLDFSTKNAWIWLIEAFLGALIVGWFVGYLAGNAKAVTLWWAALFAALGGALTSAFIAAGGPWDQQIAQALGTSDISLTSLGAASLVFGILGAAGASLAAGKKM
jgi:hypothetical protein